MGFRVLPKSNPVANATVSLVTRLGNLEANLDVGDNQVRALGIQDDGFEKPFALVPINDGSWKRLDMTYNATIKGRDYYGLEMGLLGANVPGLDFEAVRRQGVAFGIDVSGPNGADPTTLWLQSSGDNYKP
jgi:hypothetical protein